MNPISKQRTSLSNETILSTPTPTASSTVERQFLSRKLQLDKIPLTYSPDNSTTSVESLGILCVNDLPIRLSSTSVKSTSPLQKLQEQRNLVSSLLQKSNSAGLPSRYLTASETIKNCENPKLAINNESTINESDLIQGEKFSFIPAEVSTPRASNTTIASHSPTPNQRSSIGLEMSKNLSELYKEIRFSDVSLAELCKKFQKLSSLTSTTKSTDESFVSGELAGAKLDECERSWQRQHDILGGTNMKSDSMFSQLEANDEGTLSMTDFFRKKSELADLCLTTSPEKAVAPTPLIDDITQQECPSDSLRLSTSLDISSTLSISEIEKAISSHDNTTNIMDYMFEKAVVKRPSSKISDHQWSQQNKENRITETETKTAHKAPVDYEHVLKDSQNIAKTVDTDNHYEQSVTSIRTVSSLDTLPGGKLPIGSTRTELVWGCVQLGKKQIQTFVLRNKSQSKLRMQISSSSTNFKILNDHSESDAVTVLPVLLHPSESRTFSVMFMPSTIGGMNEKLKFSPISTELQMQQTKRQQLFLYGYGGHANVEILDVPKDTNLKMWLSLGKLDGTLQLTKKFNIINKGVLPAFACLSFHSKALYSHSKVTICPSELVLKPKEQAAITISYTPSKDDTKHVFAATNNQVIEMGCIQFVSGEEVLRGRIRSLFKKLNHESAAVKNPFIEKLCRRFLNEEMPRDLHKFSESIGCMKELMQNLVSREIVLTIEKDLEHTLLGQIAEMEDTSLFQSLAEGISTICVDKEQSASCIVEPIHLVLTPPIKIKDTILVINQLALPLQFETTTKPPGILSVSPCQGILSPNETIVLKITCDIKKIEKPRQILQLLVYVDNDVLEVDVKIILVEQYFSK